LNALLFLCPALFLSGFVDSVAGGGGLISMPAILLTGLPLQQVYGINKFTAASGTTFSAFRYFRHGAVDIKIALLSACGAFLASSFSSRAVLLLPERLLKGALLCLMPLVVVLILMKKKGSDTNRSTEIPIKKRYLMGFLIGMIVGCYDGLFGPGTGTIAILVYCYLMKYDMKTAGGNAKILNLASNYAALVTYILAGTINYAIAVPAACCCIVGNLIGSGLALKKGSVVIRPIMLVVAALLIGKTVMDFF